MRDCFSCRKYTRTDIVCQWNNDHKNIGCGIDEYGRCGRGGMIPGKSILNCGEYPKLLHWLCGVKTFIWYTSFKNWLFVARRC